LNGERGSFYNLTNQSKFLNANAFDQTNTSKNENLCNEFSGEQKLKSCEQEKFFKSKLYSSCFMHEMSELEKYIALNRFDCRHTTLDLVNYNNQFLANKKQKYFGASPNLTNNNENNNQQKKVLVFLVNFLIL
jgi:hypothetical protein